MTLTRRLVAAGGGLTFTPPPAPDPPLPVASVLTAAPNGGNNQLTIPSALYHATPDKTYITYVDRGGSVEGIEYDHATGLVGGPYTIHATFHVDAHDSPAIVRRASDGKFIVVYSSHNSTPFNLKVSNSANSLNGWNNAVNLDSELGGSRYTDYSIWEYSANLYLTYRDEPSAGTDSRWCISTNDSATPTTGWAAQTILYRISGTRSYMITYFDAANARLHFIVTNGANTGFTKLGHFYRDMAAGTYHESDGGSMGSPPFTFTDATEIASGSALFPWNMTADSSGYPVVAARNGAKDYLYIRWNGSTWATTNVVNSGTGYEYGGAGTGFIAYGAAVDDGDPNMLWLIKDVSSQPEVFLYETANSGASFSNTQVTTSSTALQTQLICIRSPHTDLRAFWMRGPFTTYTNWNTGLVGAGIS